MSFKYALQELRKDIEIKDKKLVHFERVLQEEFDQKQAYYEEIQQVLTALVSSGYFNA